MALRIPSVFSISFSMISYFILAVVLKNYPYQLEQVNFVAYILINPTPTIILNWNTGLPGIGEKTHRNIQY